ncbi:MAG: folate-binding protein YgfZ [Frankiales bacterium]|nr:folate-binding protein YgfZ [Frankiales bacterium]
MLRPGAIPADPPDTGVAAHYGDPYREQRLLEAGEALVDLSHHDVVRIDGPDRLTWLHSLLSQHVLALGVEPVQALVLSPQGHVEHHLQLTDDGVASWAVVEPGTGPALVAFLQKMQFMMRVTVAASAERVWTSRGLMTPGELGAWDRPVAGVLAFEALRVAARRPRFGLDTDHRTLPHEVGWLATAVHLDKGCYRGQESVARVYNLGRPPRRTVLLHLDGSDSDLPDSGAPVLLGDKEVGRVGSSARHHELGPIALALVKRQVPDDAALVAGGIAAAVDPADEPDVPESPARAAAAARAGLLRF